MVSRLLFAAVTFFFLLMNALLWRSEISGRDKTGSPIALQSVWAKMVTAPDRSTLEIRHRDKKIGYCHWAPNVGAELATGVRMTENAPPEGMIRNITGYTVDFDGSASIAESVNVRFESRLLLTTNYLWKTLHISLHFRSGTYFLTASADSDQMTFGIEQNDQQTLHTVTRAELRDPEELLRRLGNPLVADLIKAIGFPFPSASNNTPPPIHWEARQDRMTLGHTKLRVFRLQTRLFDQFQIAALVSPVGEILRIELPDGVVFVNEALNL